MKSAGIHPTESERLSSLKKLNVLDTLPEKDFDDLTFLASQICDVPIALVSLVDETRQWFKSKVGLNVEETSRDISFCAHTILDDELMIVSDSRTDNRFHDNPLVTGDPKVIFYAGAPLFSPEGFAIGTLCVIDNKPRTLNENQKAALKALSRQISRLLDMRVQIVEQKLISEKLEQTRTLLESSRAHLKRILDAVPVMIGHWDKNLNNLVANENYSEYFGMAPEQIKGRSIRELLGEEIFKLNYPFMKKALEGEAQAFERIMPIPDGSQRHVLAYYLPDTQNGEVVGFFAIVTDITKIKNLESDRQDMAAKMVESAKLSSLGEMAGGIAHEINTPLAIIMAKASMLLEEYAQGQFDATTAIKQIEKIKLTTDRIAKIIKGLRLFSRNSEADVPEAIQISSVIEATLDLCQEKLAQAEIKFVKVINHDCSISGKLPELSQVIMNLMSNAIDAVSELTTKWIHLEVTQSDGRCLITLTDSGSGISAEIQEKMMNPFFTTKEIGKGTGLGLSISSGIIKSHGGKIWYDSESPNTKFVVELPLLAATKSESAA